MSHPQPHPHSRPRIGLIGFGEVARHLVAGWRQAGWADIAAQVASDRGLAAARADGVPAAIDARVLADRDVVLACVPGRAMVAAAGAARPGLRPGVLYLDLASADPAAKVAAARQLPPGCFVDGAILGSAVESRHRVPVVLSGPGAVAVTHVLAPLGMNLEVVGDTVGQAASIKLTRSIFLKGIEALYVETLVTARRLGVFDPVRHSLDRFLDARPAAATATLLLRSHLAHAGRRAEEVTQAAALAASVGVAPVLASATAQVMARSAAADLAGPAGALADLGQFIALLDAALAPMPVQEPQL